MTFDANHDICLATCDMMVTIYLSWQAKRCTVGVCQTFQFEVVGRRIKRWWWVLRMPRGMLLIRVHIMFNY